MPSTALQKIQKKLSPEEIDFLNQLTKPGAKLDILLPDAPVPMKEWLRSTRIVCLGIAKAQMQEMSLMPILGRLLLIAKQHPEIWNSKYERFDDFEAGEVYDQWGVRRSTCREARRLAERLPEITPTEFQAIGRRNAQLLMTAIPKGDEDKPKAKELIEQAKELNSTEFRELCEGKNYVERGDTTGAFIRIGTSKRIAKRWEKFSTNPDITGYLETANQGKILERMMEECEATWLADLADQEAASEGDEEDEGEEVPQEVGA